MQTLSKYITVLVHHLSYDDGSKWNVKGSPKNLLVHTKWHLNVVILKTAWLKYFNHHLKRAPSNLKTKWGPADSYKNFKIWRCHQFQTRLKIHSRQTLCHFLFLIGHQLATKSYHSLLKFRHKPYKIEDYRLEQPCTVPQTTLLYHGPR